MILIFWRKPFFVVFATDSSEKKAQIFNEDLAFLVFAISSSKKRLNFGRRSFFYLRHQFGQKKARISDEDLSLLVRWNGGGPLEPCQD